MDTNLRERFKDLVLAADKSGIGNAEGLMKYITDLMFQAVEHYKSESEAGVGDLQAQVKVANDAFVWLLGYTDFPTWQEGECSYYWRSTLRKKLNESGFELDLPQPPQQ